MKPTGLKQMPSLRSDEEAENFVANSDLTEYDLSGFKTVHFEFEPKLEDANLKLPEKRVAIKMELLSDQV